MKKTIGTLIIFIAVSLSAHTQTVVSYMGAAKVETVNGLQLLSFPFGDASINDLGLTNGVGSTSVTTADNMYVYVPGSGYQTYFYLGDSLNNAAYDYKWVDLSFKVATNVLPGASGIWYRSRSNDTVTNILSGNIPMAQSNELQIVEGLQLIAWPYSTDLDINSAGLTNGVGSTSITTADNIYVYEPGSGYQTYFYLGDSLNNAAYDYKWVDSGFNIVTNKISPSQGLWYRCRKSGGYTWTLKRPYLNEESE
jgi:hypothetical protein